MRVTRELDTDIREAMEKDLKARPQHSVLIRLHYGGLQILRNRAKEYPYHYEVTKYHLRALRKKRVPFYSFKTNIIAGLGEVTTIGFKTLDDFKKAMQVFNEEE